MQDPVIIIGMHRAGTSLLTDLLQKTGVFVGKDLDDNFESQFFVRLNRWTFAQSGARWDRPENMQFSDDYLIERIARNINHHLHSRGMRAYGRSLSALARNEKAWGWKDPRNTFTLPVWLRLFPNAKIIHIRRNPIDVARSLQKREQNHRRLHDSQRRTGLRKKWHEHFLTGKPLYSLSPRVLGLEEGIMLWKDYTGKALQYSDRVFNLKYENLLANPKPEFEALCDFLNFSPETSVRQSILANIRPDRRYAFLQEESLKDLCAKFADDPIVKAAGYRDVLSDFKEDRP